MSESSKNFTMIFLALPHWRAFLLVKTRPGGRVFFYLFGDTSDHNDLMSENLFLVVGEDDFNDVAFGE